MHQQAISANFFFVPSQQFYHMHSLCSCSVDSAVVLLSDGQPSLAVACVSDIIFYDCYGRMLQLIFQLLVLLLLLPVQSYFSDVAPNGEKTETNA